MGAEVLVGVAACGLDGWAGTLTLGNPSDLAKPSVVITEAELNATIDGVYANQAAK